MPRKRASKTAKNPLHKRFKSFCKLCLKSVRKTVKKLKRGRIVPKLNLSNLGFVAGLMVLILIGLSLYSVRVARTQPPSLGFLPNNFTASLVLDINELELVKLSRIDEANTCQSDNNSKATFVASEIMTVEQLIHDNLVKVSEGTQMMYIGIGYETDLDELGRKEIVDQHKYFRVSRAIDSVVPEFAIDVITFDTLLREGEVLHVQFSENVEFCALDSSLANLLEVDASGWYLTYVNGDVFDIVDSENKDSLGIDDLEIVSAWQTTLYTSSEVFDVSQDLEEGLYWLQFGYALSDAEIAAQRAADVDLDGVPNADDKCDEDSDGFGPTAAGEVVDENGCSAQQRLEDLDGDGIHDSLDNDKDGDGVLTDQDADDSDDSVGIDTDGDGQADVTDDDIDNDGVPNAEDKCDEESDGFGPTAAGVDSADVDDKGCSRAQRDEDLDNDGIHDSLDDDKDGDSVDNDEDLDPENSSVGADTDGDLVADAVDNCPDVVNPDQLDSDGDDIGDLCDNDKDNDGVIDNDDNCLLVPNPNQSNLDEDVAGDVCDVDIDGDGIVDFDESGALQDLCPFTDPTVVSVTSYGCATDVDRDNAYDLAPVSDGSSNLTGDVIMFQEAFDAQDGVYATVAFVDNCLDMPNPGQRDFNNDGLGDACSDADNDTVLDVIDNCPLVANIEQFDMDEDLIGDECDPDRDGDGINELSAEEVVLDNCPLVPNASQTDSNGNGVGDACDGDFNAMVSALNQPAFACEDSADKVLLYEYDLFVHSVGQVDFENLANELNFTLSSLEFVMADSSSEKYSDLTYELYIDDYLIDNLSFEQGSLTLDGLSQERDFQIDSRQVFWRIKLFVRNPQNEGVVLDNLDTVKIDIDNFVINSEFELFETLIPSLERRPQSPLVLESGSCNELEIAPVVEATVSSQSVPLFCQEPVDGADPETLDLELTVSVPALNEQVTYPIEVLFRFSSPENPLRGKEFAGWTYNDDTGRYSQTVDVVVPRDTREVTTTVPLLFDLVENAQVFEGFEVEILVGDESNNSGRYVSVTSRPSSHTADSCELITYELVVDFDFVLACDQNADSGWLDIASFELQSNFEFSTEAFRLQMPGSNIVDSYDFQLKEGDSNVFELHDVSFNDLNTLFMVRDGGVTTNRQYVLQTRAKNGIDSYDELHLWDESVNSIAVFSGDNRVDLSLDEFVFMQGATDSEVVCKRFRHRNFEYAIREEQSLEGDRFLASIATNPLYYVPDDMANSTLDHIITFESITQGGFGSLPRKKVVVNKSNVDKFFIEKSNVVYAFDNQGTDLIQPFDIESLELIDEDDACQQSGDYYIANVTLKDTNQSADKIRFNLDIDLDDFRINGVAVTTGQDMFVELEADGSLNLARPKQNNQSAQAFVGVSILNESNVQDAYKAQTLMGYLNFDDEYASGFVLSEDNEFEIQNKFIYDDLCLTAQSPEVARTESSIEVPTGTNWQTPQLVNLPDLDHVYTTGSFGSVYIEGNEVKTGGPLSDSEDSSYFPDFNFPGILRKPLIGNAVRGYVPTDVVLFDSRTFRLIEANQEHNLSCDPLPSSAEILTVDNENGLNQGLADGLSGGFVLPKFANLISLNQMYPDNISSSSVILHYFGVLGMDSVGNTGSMIRWMFGLNQGASSLQFFDTKLPNSSGSFENPNGDFFSSTGRSNCKIGDFMQMLIFTGGYPAGLQGVNGKDELQSFMVDEEECDTIIDSNGNTRQDCYGEDKTLWDVIEERLTSEQVASLEDFFDTNSCSGYFPGYNLVGRLYDNRFSELSIDHKWYNGCPYSLKIILDDPDNSF